MSGRESARALTADAKVALAKPRPETDGGGRAGELWGQGKRPRKEGPEPSSGALGRTAFQVIGLEGGREGERGEGEGVSASPGSAAVPAAGQVRGSHLVAVPHSVCCWVSSLGLRSHPAHPAMQLQPRAKQLVTVGGTAPSFPASPSLDILFILGTNQNPPHTGS